MKFWKFILTLIACLYLNQAYCTLHEFNGPDFCTIGAKETIDHFNELTKNEIEGFQKKINSLKAKRQIISDMQSLRREYLLQLGSINSENGIPKSVAQYKYLLNKALTLDAISLLSKDELSSMDTQTVTSLCPPQNAENPFCKRYGEQANMQGKGTSSEIKTLNETLASFAESMNQISDKASVARDVYKILSSIPEGIRPDEVLESFAKNAPGLLEILTKASSQEEVTKCLDNEGKTCGLSSSDIIKIKEELKAVGNEFSEKYSNVKKKIDDQNSNGPKGLTPLTTNQTDKETDDLKKEITSLLDKDSRINKIEKMAQFVIQRYRRGCSQAKENSLSSNLPQIIKCLNMNPETLTSTDKIDSLSSSLNDILGKLGQENTISDERGELGLFSKSELKEYKQSCQNISTPEDSYLLRSCNKVDTLYSNIAFKKESKEWDSFYKKNWSRSVPKESNASIYAAGFIQSINTIGPIFLQNYGLKNQIGMMETQALWQQNYMNSWSMNPYFQGSYLGTPGLFTGYNFQLGIDAPK